MLTWRRWNVFLKSWRRKFSKSAGTQLRYMISLMAPMARVASSEPACCESCWAANWKTTARSLQGGNSIEFKNGSKTPKLTKNSPLKWPKNNFFYGRLWKMSCNFSESSMGQRPVQISPLTLTLFTVTPCLQFQIWHVPNDWFVTKFLWLHWQSGYCDTYLMSRVWHCKRGPLYCHCPLVYFPSKAGEPSKKVQNLLCHVPKETVWIVECLIMPARKFAQN